MRIETTDDNVMCVYAFWQRRIGVGGNTQNGPIHRT